MTDGMTEVLHVGLLIFAFYFTSKSLLYYQNLLVNMEQSSKKYLEFEQVQNSWKRLWEQGTLEK